MKKRILSVLLALCVILPLLPATALAKMPSDGLTVNEFEWEVLRLVNIERANAGLSSLSMMEPLQQSCNVREKEIGPVFSHTRPDGSDCYTAIPKTFKWKAAGENIAKGQRNPAEVMDSWMNSPPHRANILSKDFGYIGIGYYSSGNCWVQMFASREAITSCTVSTDERAFETEDAIAGEYVTCKTSDGYTSYLPLDFDSLQEKDGTFLPRLPAKNLPSFTFGSTETSYMEKNKEAALAAVEAMKITNDFTQDDLDDVLLEACTYSAGLYAGPSVATDNFRLTPATADKAGYMEAAVTIAENTDIIDFTVKKEIPKLTGNSPAATPEEELAAAKAAITAAIRDMAATNDTAAANILSAAETALPDGSTVSVNWGTPGFSLTKATAQAEGAITGTLKLTADLPAGAGAPEETGFIDSPYYKELTAGEADKMYGGGETFLLLLYKDGCSNCMRAQSYLKTALGEKKARLYGVNLNIGQVSFVWKFAGSGSFTTPLLVMVRSKADVEVKTGAYTQAIIDPLLEKAGTSEPFAGGTISDTVQVNKTLAKLTAADATDKEKIAADKADMITAISAMAGTNAMTRDEILEVARAAAGNGAAVVWANDYEKVDATVAATGSIKGTLNLKLNGETLTLKVSKTIPKLAAPAFADVKADAYYADAVAWAVERKITIGTSATMFSPADTCTRAHILTFLWRAVGSPESSAANPFTDVKSTDYYYGAALWAGEKGMVTGTTFAGDTPCTRSSTVTYLWQNAGSPGAAVPGSFTDVPVDASYAKAVAWAVETGVTTGTSATAFSPDTICDRGQIVTFLYRALG